MAPDKERKIWQEDVAIPGQEAIQPQESYSLLSGRPIDHAGSIKNKMLSKGLSEEDTLIVDEEYRRGKQNREDEGWFETSEGFDRMYELNDLVKELPSAEKSNEIDFIRTLKDNFNKAGIKVRIEDEGRTKTPTFRDYQESIAGEALDQSSKYPEESGINNLMQKSSPAAQKLSTLGKQPARERAINGATLGSAIGSQVMGKEGAIIGAHIGAIAGRGAGMAQSGEQAKMARDSRIWNSLKTMGAVQKDGRVDFEDSSIRMPNEATGRLKNLRINPLNGNKDRNMYELDKTNPLTSRALTVARPLAKFYASGLLGYSDKDEVGKGAAPASMALFANMFTDGVDNEKAVYSRAQQMAKKMGVKEKSIKAYFETIKKDLSFDEAQDIQKGLDIIFAKKK